ncbi:MAG: calcineurin-like phosphoesterase C-terminal domain-containing protein [bacterium]
MRSVCLSLILGITIFGLFSSLPASDQQYAVGIVYNDLNQNRHFDPSEKGIPNVRISNGRDIVLTNELGKYRIPIEEGMTLFVIKPTGWTTPFDTNNFPLFYYIYKPNGSPKTKYPGSEPTGPLPASIDFPLYQQQELNQFKAIFFGDIQVARPQDINYFAHEVVEELIGTDAKFIMTLGDNAGNTLSLYPDLKSTCGVIGRPFYFVKGNHDTNYDVASTKNTRETYTRYFGPSYYSFDYGKVHLIALDNIQWLSQPGENVSRNYLDGLDPDQLEFFKNDINLVPPDYLIVLAMHIPIHGTNQAISTLLTGSENTSNDINSVLRLIKRRLSKGIVETSEILPLLKDHPKVFAIAGHEHVMSSRFLTRKDGWLGTEPVYHLINGTVCGSWWRGVKDEVGMPIPIMADGAPNGYSIITFTDNQYAIEYKAVKRPLSYQMTIFAPDEITVDQMTATEIIVNIFAGSTKSKVEFRIEHKTDWLPMQKVAMEDPYYLLLKKPDDEQTKTGWQRLPEPKISKHIWRATLPDLSGEKGSKLITVRTRDIFGHTYTATRVITIK